MKSMIKELEILVEVEKSLKILNSINFDKLNELKKHIENIRELQLQSFVEISFVILHPKDSENFRIHILSMR